MLVAAGIPGHLYSVVIRWIVVCKGNLFFTSEKVIYAIKLT